MGVLVGFEANVQDAVRKTNVRLRKSLYLNRLHTRHDYSVSRTNLTKLKMRIASP